MCCIGVQDRFMLLEQKKHTVFANEKVFTLVQRNDLWLSSVNMIYTENQAVKGTEQKNRTISRKCVQRTKRRNVSHKCKE
jgi:hypothetical protein